MKYLIILTLITLSIGFVSCQKHVASSGNQLDSTNLANALLQCDPVALEKEIKKLSFDLVPFPSDSNPSGQSENIAILLERITKCKNIISVEIQCFACLKTYPPQTEILVSIDSAGHMEQRILDIATPKDNILSFANVHKANFTSGSMTIFNKYYVGCFKTKKETEAKKSRLVEKRIDTIYYEFENDIMNLHVNMNYNCCGAPIDSVVIGQKGFEVYIQDTCTVNCVCRCSCNYSFNYGLCNITNKRDSIIVYLKEYNAKEYHVWNKIEYDVNMNWE
ncbi:MAG: hypothetical protein IPO21_21355 [Bacteroidales bacterium]|nr:hypothetical protein [Bacteroidales bacterium]